MKNAARIAPWWNSSRCDKSRRALRRVFSNIRRCQTRLVSGRLMLFHLLIL
jgi:hypothetical protein